MNRIWRIVMIVVLVAILAGAVCVGVGLMTGGKLDHVYSAMDEKYRLGAYVEAYVHYVRVDLANYFRQAWAAVTAPAA